MKMSFGFFGAFLACLVPHAFPALAGTPITDDDWTSLNANGNPGTDGAVSDLAYRNGKLYMNGSYKTIGDTAMSGIVVWDGNSFQAIGGGSFQLMTVAKDGAIYAGAHQDTTGGKQPWVIKKWNGSEWTALGSGFNGEFTDIEADSLGNVYAAGKFTSAGGVAAGNLAKWDGEAWKALYWKDGYTIGDVFVGPNGTIYVGGTFRGAIAKLADTSWQVVGGGLSAQKTNDQYHYVEVHSIAADKDGNLYVGGMIDFANLEPAANIVKWNGASWETLSGGVYGAIYDVAVDANGKVYAGGPGVLSQWDGSKWTRIGAGSNATIRALACDDKGKVYIGGTIHEFDKIIFGNLAIWDGKGWSSPVRSINGAILSLVSDSKGNVYAGGDFTLAGGIGVNHVAKWDGSKWSALGSGVVSDKTEYTAVWSLAVDDSDNIFAAGTFTTAGGVPVKNVARWNGARWDSLGKGLNNTATSLAHDRHGTLFAIGSFDSAGDFSVPGIARWNQGDWYPAQAGERGMIRPTAIGAAANGDVFAAGDFFNGSVWEENIGLWKNDKWTLISAGSNFSMDISSLVSDNRGNLYVGGDFKSIEGAGVNIGRWNGKVWSSLGEGLTYVSRDVFLTIDARGNVYATGDWSRRGTGDPTQYIGKWNGSSWEPLGSGVESAPLAMVAIDSTLYVGGSFNRAGKKYSPKFAKVNIHNSVNTTGIHARTLSEPAAPAWKIRQRKLLLSRLEPDDRVRLHALNGRVLFQGTGVETVDLDAYPGAPLLLDITRHRHTILRRKIEWR